MDHLNIYPIYMLGQAIEALRVGAREQKTASSLSVALATAKFAVEMMLRGGTTYRLNESASAAERLIKRLDEATAAVSGKPDDPLPPVHATSLDAAVAAFDNAMSVEFGRAPIFFVKPKGVFDTRLLIVRASWVYSEPVLTKLPKEAIEDTNQAGRCLAFSLGTAAGFHIARATEGVIKKYMQVFGCAEPKESQRNWGFYIKSLNDAGANKKVTRHLEQIKDLHRNPLIHPEVNLTVTEALSLWAMCTSAIQASVADMETKATTPNTEILAMIPTEP